MHTISEEVQISGPPDEAWRRFGGFGDIGEWHPLLQSVIAQGNHIGAKRTAKSQDGGTQIERLTGYDAKAHSYSYEMEESALPVENYTADFSIEPDKSGSKVCWSASFDVEDGEDDDVAGAVREFIRTGLDALSKRAGRES